MTGASKIMKIPLCLSLFAPLIAVAQPNQMIMKGPSSIFAFQGKSCPLGSKPYKGPEAKKLTGTGVIYCEFERNVIVLNKKEVAACPPAIPPYVDPAVAPDDDVIWCQMRPPKPLPPPKAPNLAPPAPKTPKNPVKTQ
jgi:hypothetical protein